MQKELIAILTDDENLTESVSKILGTVFSNQFAAQCSWDGQSGIKIENFFILKKIRGNFVLFVFQLKILYHAMHKKNNYLESKKYF